MGRIDRLLAAMTLEEKIGQLNMVASSGAVTGPGAPRDVAEGIRAGRIGALLNLWGADETRAVQRLAVQEVSPRRSLAAGPRRHPRPPHDFPGAAGRGLPVRSRGVGEDGARGGRGSRPRRRGDDLRADARRGARPALGAHRRGSRRRPLGRLADRRGENARLPGRRPFRRRQPRRRRQAFGRLWRGDRGARIRFGGSVRENAARGLSAAVRGGGRSGSGGDHARLQRHRRRSDDRQRLVAARLAAAAPGFRRRADQRLQRHRRAHRSRRGGRRRGGRRARPRGRRRHRHDGRRLRPGPARGAAARTRRHGGYRRERAARARSEGAPRPVRRSLSARRGRRGRERSARLGATRTGARRRPTRDRAAHLRARRVAAFAQNTAPRPRRPAGRSAARNAGTMGRGGPRRGGRVHPAGARSRPARMPDRLRRGRRYRLGRHARRRRRRRCVPRRRRDRALPRRGRFDKRRGGEFAPISGCREASAPSPRRFSISASPSWRSSLRGARSRCRGSSRARTRFSPRGFSASRPATPSPTF